MKDLELFELGTSGSVRFGATEEGEPYAIASDFAKAMGYRDASDAVRLLDDTESGTQIVRTRSVNGIEQDRQMSVIYEDGMWELIFRSTLPGAKALKGRVKEVLKEIRKTGSYGVKPALPQSYTDALRELLTSVESLEAANQKIQLDAPKVEGYEDLMDAEGYFSMEATAKLLSSVTGGLGRNSFIGMLRAKRVFLLNGTTPYQQYIDLGYFVVKVLNTDKGPFEYSLATPKGLDWLRRKFKSEVA